jgi:hypothetical protein
MADVNGTINVEVLYREAGSPGSGGGGEGSSADGAGAADEKKKKQAMSESNKFLKGIMGTLTIGAMMKQSKLASGFLGTLSQLLGALIDVFLMPFIPLLIPVLKFLAGVISWFAKFMQDPYGTIKELFFTLKDAIMDAITGGFDFFSDFSIDWQGIWASLKGPIWADLWDGIQWSAEKVIPMLVGGAGLITAAFLSNHIFGAASSLKNGILKALGIGGGGGKGVLDGLKNCCPPGGGVATPVAGGRAGFFSRMATQIKNFGTTIALAAAAFKGIVVQAATFFMQRMVVPVAQWLAGAVLPILNSTIGTALLIPLAAGAAAVASIVLASKIIQKFDDNRDVSAPGVKREAFANMPDSMRIGLEAYQRQLGERRYLDGMGDELILEDAMRGQERTRDFTAAFQRFTKEGESSDLVQLMNSGQFDQGFTDKGGYVQDATSGKELVVTLGMTDSFMADMFEVVDNNIRDGKNYRTKLAESSFPVNYNE